MAASPSQTTVGLSQPAATPENATSPGQTTAAAASPAVAPESNELPPLPAAPGRSDLRKPTAAETNPPSQAPASTSESSGLEAAVDRPTPEGGITVAPGGSEALPLLPEQNLATVVTPSRNAEDRPADTCRRVLPPQAQLNSIGTVRREQGNAIDPNPADAAVNLPTCRAWIRLFPPLQLRIRIRQRTPTSNATSPSDRTAGGATGPGSCSDVADCCEPCVYDNEL